MPMLQNFKLLGLLGLDFKKVLRLCLFMGLQFCTLFSFAHPTRWPKYSNVIIFGDSQSDIGNGPESLTYHELNVSTGVSKIATALYVPISNPVDRQQDTVLPNLNIDFPPSSRIKKFALTLPKALPICTHGRCHAKKYRSLNWVEYFMYNAAKDGLIDSPADLRPWVMQYRQHTRASIHHSVDYAFYSAMSNAQCSHVPFPYAPTACTHAHLSLNDSIYQQQQKYRTQQSAVNHAANAYLRQQIIIPSLQKQIQLFKYDLRHNTVKVNPHTLYIVWTGVNDIGLVFHRYGKKEISSHVLNDKLNHDIPHLIAGHEPQSIVNQLLRLGAQHILVIGQYNLGFMPGALAKQHLGLVRHIIIKKATHYIRQYNQSLQRLILKNFNPKKVKYIEIQAPIAAQVSFSGYANTLGSMCNTRMIAQRIQQGDAISCDDNRHPGIGWWNQAHLATQLNQLIAAIVLDNVSSPASSAR